MKCESCGSTKKHTVFYGPARLSVDFTDLRACKSLGIFHTDNEAISLWLSYSSNMAGISVASDEYFVLFIERTNIQAERVGAFISRLAGMIDLGVCDLWTMKDNRWIKDTSMECGYA